MAERSGALAQVERNAVEAEVARSGAQIRVARNGTEAVVVEAELGGSGTVARAGESETLPADERAALPGESGTVAPTYESVALGGSGAARSAPLAEYRRVPPHR